MLQVHFSLSALLMLQVHFLLTLKFWLITFFRYHVTEYCAVIGTHSTVWGDKLFYGHVPDPSLGAEQGLATRD